MSTGNNLNYSYLAADWLLPIVAKPIKNAVLILNNQHIFDICSKDEFDQRFSQRQKEKLLNAGLYKDYKQAIIMPGLINLHTHLDYSSLKFLNTQKKFFFDWIRTLVISSRKFQPDDWKKSALLGAKEIALSGTTCVADSSYTGAAAWGLAQIGLRGLVGLELFGIDENIAQHTWQKWLDKYNLFIKNAQEDNKLKRALASELIKITIAPHAPYTVCPSLLQEVIEWSKSHNLPYLIHLAESEAECAWIEDNNDCVDNYLSFVFQEKIEKIQNLSWRQKGLTPVNYLYKQKFLNSLTVASHVVHVSNDELSLLQQNQVKVIHCPRSNALLMNGTAPMKSFIEMELEFGFGTDSAASAFSLNVLEEALFAVNLLKATNPQFNVSSEKVIHHLTFGAANIIGQANNIGSLEPNKLADIAIFGLKDSSLHVLDQLNPYDLILHGQAQLIDLFVSGKKIVNEGTIIN
jgi:5-methylthioadenosine/S-adenosylhomocysteine deaminase